MLKMLSESNPNYVNHSSGIYGFKVFCTTPLKWLIVVAKESMIVPAQIDFMLVFTELLWCDKLLL